jgi:hypothetical protein
MHVAAATASPSPGRVALGLVALERLGADFRVLRQ